MNPEQIKKGLEGIIWQLKTIQMIVPKGVKDGIGNIISFLEEIMKLQEKAPK